MRKHHGAGPWPPPSRSPRTAPTRNARPGRARPTARRRSRDARKHEPFAREVLARGENAARFAEFREGLRQALAPEGELEDALCARIVGCLWRLRRVVRLESSMVGNEDGMTIESLLERGWLRDDECDWLQLFSQYETRLDRMLHRALHELQRLQARRDGVHVPPPLVVDVDVHGLASLEDPPEPMPTPSLRG